jgi:uncharacterized protein YkwD
VSGAPSNSRAALFTSAMNARRTNAGLPALVLDSTLSTIAHQRGMDMQSNGYFAHVSPTGESWLTLLKASGMSVKGGGENLARVSGDVNRSVEVAIAKLMESPTHRANILHTGYTHVGVAAVTDDQGVTVFVTVFAVR